MRLFAACAPGLEGVLAAEITALGMAARPEAGGVEWEGELAPALLHLRTASRLLVRLGGFEARDFAAMVRRAKDLPWDRCFSATTPLAPRFAVTCRRCRLFHTGAIAERLRAALDARVPGLDGGPEVRVVVRGEDDRFEISVDAGGEPMHRRGYREAQGAAPLRETLAAGLLLLARWDPATPLVDPFCGAGTIPIEAARLARGKPPGLERAFAAERFPSWDAARWQALRAAVAVSPPHPSIHGRDADPRAIARARDNAARAGETIAWSCVDVAQSTLPDGPAGLVLGNPPYGERLGAARAIYAAAGKLQRSRPGWRLALLTSDVRLAGAAGDIAEKHLLVNGGLKVGLYEIRR